PTNISTKSDPLIVKKGVPASPATARANNVLPVPGGPTNSTPLGIRAPTFLNLRGSFKNSTTSTSSCFSSSAPATSVKRVFSFSSLYNFALLLPNCITLPPPPPPCALVNKKKKITTINKNGNIIVNKFTIALGCSSCSTFNTLCSFAKSVTSAITSVFSGSCTTNGLLPSSNSPVTTIILFFGCIVISAISLLSKACINSFTFNSSDCSFWPLNIPTTPMSTKKIRP